MTDIQRYEVNKRFLTKADLLIEGDDEVVGVVLNDDRIAEVDGWKKKVEQCVDSKLELQARIDELNDLLSKVDAERKLRGLKIIELQTKLHKLEAKQ